MSKKSESIQKCTVNKDVACFWNFLSIIFLYSILIYHYVSTRKWLTSNYLKNKFKQFFCTLFRLMHVNTVIETPFKKNPF
jgi:hypothetical protein